MRLIDADAVIDKMRDAFDMQDLYLPIHFKQFVIDDMPTVCDIEQIRAEIAEYKDDKVIHAEQNEMIDIVLEIIDKYTNGGMSPEVKEHYEQLAEHYNKKGKKG